MEPQIEKAKRKKQLMTLCILALLLCLIVFRPAINWAMQQVLPRAPVRLGTAEVVIPKTWVLSRRGTKIHASKPHATILYNSSSASFFLEERDLPEDVWEHSARKVLNDRYPGQILTTKTINGDSGPVKCIELTLPELDAGLLVSCINPDLHLTSTFAGQPSLVSEFYAVLAAARKSP